MSHLDQSLDFKLNFKVPNKPNSLPLNQFQSIGYDESASSKHAAASVELGPPLDLMFSYAI